MTLIVLGEAGEEFAKSVQYYESKEVGLGARFRDELVEAVLGPARLRRNRRFDHDADNTMVHEEMLPTKHTKHADKAESA
jgi:hypothetical protein